MEYTISLSTLLAIGANIFLGIAIPIALYVFFRKKYMCDNRVFVAGCSTMIAISLLAEMLISYFFLPTTAGQYIYERPWLYGLFVGLVAALIHEPGRYVCAKFFLRDELWNDHNALMFGAGYGSLIILSNMLMSSVSNFLLARMIAKGQVSVYLENLSPENLEVAQEALSTLCNTSVASYLMLTVEQCVSIAAHLGLTVLVWFAVQGGKKKVKYLLLAMGLNFVLASVTCFAGGYSASAALLLLLQAMLTAGIVYVSMRVWKKEFRPLEVP